MAFDFRALCLYPPDTAEALFRAVKRCFAAYAPERLRDWRPAPAEDILRLERHLAEEYGAGIPPVFRIFLEKMGASDGGILSRQLSDPEFWSCFQGENLARGILWHLRETECRRARRGDLSPRPYWYFYYTAFDGTGLGFACGEEPPDRLLEVHGAKPYFTQNTFTKLLFSYTIRRLALVLMSQNPPLEGQRPHPRGFHAVRFWAGCPDSWAVPGHGPLRDFLEALEARFPLEECWFGSKTFSLWDQAGRPVRQEASHTWYAAFHAAADVLLCLQYEQGSGGTWPRLKGYILSQDARETQALMGAIGEYAKLETSRWYSLPGEL